MMLSVPLNFEKFSDFKVFAKSMQHKTCLLHTYMWRKASFKSNLKLAYLRMFSNRQLNHTHYNRSNWRSQQYCYIYAGNPHLKPHHEFSSCIHLNLKWNLHAALKAVMLPNSSCKPSFSPVRQAILRVDNIGEIYLLWNLTRQK